MTTQALLHPISNPKHNPTLEEIRTVAQRYFWSFLGRIEGILVAKDKSSRNGSSWRDISFVNVSLDGEEKKRFKVWYTDTIDDLEAHWQEHLQEGYKMSVRWDDENDCYIVASTGVTEGKPNHNFCLTSRSDVLAEAILLQVYKTDVLCKGVSWESRGKSANWG